MNAPYSHAIEAGCRHLNACEKLSDQEIERAAENAAHNYLHVCISQGYTPRDILRSVGLPYSEADHDLDHLGSRLSQVWLKLIKNSFCTCWEDEL